MALTTKTPFAIAILVATVMTIVQQAEAEEVSGQARVIDGDTIALGSQIIRLEGIDAPEIGQICQDVSGRAYQCGRHARDRLADLIDQQDISCRAESKDVYGRFLASCAVGELDLNRTLVREGLAWAFARYSQRFVGEEQIARMGHVGLWAGKAEPPWEYRAHRWDLAKQESPTGCPIKGNINRKGEHIYHAPWSPWYGRTSVDERKGERWFCDEGEALAAGWRPAHWARGT